MEVSPLDTIAAACACDHKPCICPTTTRVLQFVMSSPPGAYFTEEQRKWCLKEIGFFELHRAERYVGHDDTVLARGVMEAWRDYAREQGLL